MFILRAENSCTETGVELFSENLLKYVEKCYAELTQKQTSVLTVFRACLSGTIN